MGVKVFLGMIVAATVLAICGLFGAIATGNDPYAPEVQPTPTQTWNQFMTEVKTEGPDYAPVMLVAVPVLVLFSIAGLKFMSKVARGPLVLDFPYEQDETRGNEIPLEELGWFRPESFPYSRMYGLNLEGLSYDACYTIEAYVSQYGWTSRIKKIVAGIMVNDMAENSPTINLPEDDEQTGAAWDYEYGD